MTKKILLGSAVLVGAFLLVGVVALQANQAKAQTATAQCGSSPYTCTIGFESAGNTVGTWSCSGQTSGVQCPASTGSQGTAGSCGTYAYTCGAGTVANQGTQYVSTGDYYYWDCLGANGGANALRCTSTQASPTGPTYGNGSGASCTSNSQCANTAECISGTCQLVACGSNTACGTGDSCENPNTVDAVCVPTTSGAGSVACSGNDNCNVFQGQVCVNPGTQSSYCALPGGSAGSNLSTAFASIPGAAAGCTGDFTHNLSDTQACNALFVSEAQALGYSASCSYSTLSGASPSAAETICASEGLPNNAACLASLATGYQASCTISGSGQLGTLSGTYAPYSVVGYSGEVNGNSANTWYQLPAQSTSGTGSTGTGITGTGSTGSTGSTTGTGGFSGTGTPVTNPNISQVNADLNPAALGFSSVLSSLSGSATSLTPAAIAGTVITPATTASTGTSATGGSCANAASATITSSLQTLQSLAGILTAGNASPGVLSSVQNLINAVAQVLSALSTCLGGSSTSTGTTTTTTTTTSGTTATSGGAATITGIQGYNPTTGSYTNNAIIQGVDNYIVLYGSFSASNNVVMIDGISVTPSYQSTSQLNVPISNLTLGSHDGLLLLPATGQSQQFSFIVTAPGSTGASSTSTVGLGGSPQALLSILTTNETPNSSAAPSYSVGNPWRLVLSSGAPNAPVTLCAIDNGVSSCTPNYGTTDANGNWSLSGSFAASSIGVWQEWAQLPSPNGSGQTIPSNHLSFSVQNFNL